MYQGEYWHSECAGCASYGIECERSCEYDDNPNPRTCFIPKVDDNYEPEIED